MFGSTARELLFLKFEWKRRRIMKRSMCWTLVLCSCLVSVGGAQVVTGSGTASTIPHFTSTSSIGDSPMFELNGNIGIGERNPRARLEVRDYRDVDANGSEPYAIRAAVNCTLPNGCAAVRGDANANSVGALGVYGSNFGPGGGGVVGATSGTGFTWGVRGETVGENPFAYAVFGITHGTGGSVGLFISRAHADLLRGVVGSPDTTVFRVDGTGRVFANGGFRPFGADFAEAMVVSGERSRYEPGDLLALDASGRRRLALSVTPYSTLVAGVYSTNPAVLGSDHRIGDASSSNEVPLAIVGIVPCKVTAENGPIAVGDLLVASSTPGRAMRGTDHARMLGAVVGKALEPLNNGAGVIQVL